MKGILILSRLSLVIALAVTGCSGPSVVSVPTPQLPSGFPNHSIQEILDEVYMHAPRIDAMDTRTSLSIVSNEMTENVTAVIRFNRFTAMYASIRATVLNAEVGRSLVTPDSFYVYNRVERELIYGPVYLADRYIPISGSLEEIHEILTGGFNPDRNTNWSVGADSDLYYLRDEYSNQLYEIDPRIWRVTRYTRSSASGELLDERIFENYSDFDGIVVPRRIVLRQPNLGRTVALYHRSVVPSPATQDFDLDIDRSRIKQVLIDR